MNLQYKTRDYIRKAIRQAEFTELSSGVWHASLPAFALEVTGDNRGAAEQNLLMSLTAYVMAAPLSDLPLPVIDDIDLSPHEPKFDATSTHSREIESSPDPEQAWFWTAEWQSGEREASEDIAAGRVESFDSAQDFLASFPD